MNVLAGGDTYYTRLITGVLSSGWRWMERNDFTKLPSSLYTHAMAHFWRQSKTATSGRWDQANKAVLWYVHTHTLITWKEGEIDHLSWQYRSVQCLPPCRSPGLHSTPAVNEPKICLSILRFGLVLKNIHLFNKIVKIFFQQLVMGCFFLFRIFWFIYLFVCFLRQGFSV